MWRIYDITYNYIIIIQRLIAIQIIAEIQWQDFYIIDWEKDIINIESCLVETQILWFIDKNKRFVFNSCLIVVSSSEACASELEVSLEDIFQWQS